MITVYARGVNAKGAYYNAEYDYNGTREGFAQSLRESATRLSMRIVEEGEGYMTLASTEQSAPIAAQRVTYRYC